MAVVDVFDREKNVVRQLTLPDEVFGVQVRPEILNQAVKAALANKRTATASVKNRSSIRGGGRKPWRQKGTGRARAGTVRSPLWKGGAVIHGPKPQKNHGIKLNKKVRRLALRMALSSKLAENGLFVVESFDLERPKTKDFVEIQKRLELGGALIVVPEKSGNLGLATRNIQGVKVVEPNQVGVYEILAYPSLVMTPEVVENLQQRLQ
jgi:large subunit ribosomal protein L4